MTRIRLALFDLDDTLFDHRGAVDDAIVRTLRGLGRPVTAALETAETARWTALEEEHYHRYLTGELDYQGQRRARARAFMAPHQGDALDDAAADAWFEAYLEGYRDAYRLHDDALPCLDAIAPHARIGIITNGDPAFQTAKLAALGLIDRVEHLVCSGALPFAKPDARIFASALDLFGAAPDEALYVGDRLRTDAIGAARAGLTGVWLDRTGAPVVDADGAEGARLSVHRATGLDAVARLVVTG